MTNWPEFARKMLDGTMEAYWPLGRVPRDEEEAERRCWPWPLDEQDQRQLATELSQPAETTEAKT